MYWTRLENHYRCLQVDILSLVIVVVFTNDFLPVFSVTAWALPVLVALQCWHVYIFLGSLESLSSASPSWMSEIVVSTRTRKTPSHHNLDLISLQVEYPQAATVQLMIEIQNILQTVTLTYLFTIWSRSLSLCEPYSKFVEIPLVQPNFGRPISQWLLMTSGRG